MNSIARNAIYAAIAITLWPHTMYANTHLEQLSSECPPLQPPQFVPATQFEYTVETSVGLKADTQPGVSFEMRPGRLKPQLERVLRQHLGVQHLVWEAAEEHEWPSAYKLHATSWPALVESLLVPYQLRLQLFVNHSAVISYRQQAGGGHAD